MQRYFPVLEKVKLFNDIDEKNLYSILTCLDGKLRDYKKDEFIFRAGDEVNHIGVILIGSAHVLKENIEGDRTIMSILEEGDYFAEALCCAGVKESPVSVQTCSDAAVLLLDFSRILRTCSNSCAFHTKLIENMLYVLADKNITLQNRMEVISQKSLRAKILNYLQAVAQKQGRSMKIPFNREELADFLCVDRSSLSHELSRMKQDGIIDFHKNKFQLL